MAADFSNPVGTTVVPESAADLCKSAAKRLAELALVVRTERESWNVAETWDEDRLTWLLRWKKELQNELSLYVYATIEATSEGSMEVKGLVRRRPTTMVVSEGDRSAKPIEEVRVVVPRAFPWDLARIPIKTEGIFPAEETQLVLTQGKEVNIEEIVLRPDAWLFYTTKVPQFNLLAHVEYTPPRDLIDWYIYSFPALHCLFGENSTVGEVLPPEIKRLIWRALHGLPPLHGLPL